MLSAEQIQSLAQLPVQALLVISVYALWKALIAAQNARVEDLKSNYQQNMNDLRTRIVLLEARMGLNDANYDTQPVTVTKTG